MIDTVWISEVLLDLAAFAEENDLPEIYDALITAMAITTIETQKSGHLKQRNTGNVVPLFKHGNVKVALP